MEQREDQRLYVILLDKEHDVKISMRALEMAVCNAVLDETSKLAVVGDIYYGDLRKVVQDIAARNKIEAPDGIFGFFHVGEENSDEFAKRKILAVRPAQGWTTVPEKVNGIIELNKTHFRRRFCHFMTDDLIITAEWNPLMIETMMDDFGFPFYVDPKMSQANTVFGKLNPSKTFVYQKKVGDKPVLPYPVVTYTADDDRYFVFDTASAAWGEGGVVPINTHVRNRFMPVYLYALVEKGVLPSYDYLPDPFLSVVVTRNPLFRKMSDEVKRVLAADLRNDMPYIDKLNRDRRENDFERWPDVLKKLTDGCDRLEKKLLENSNA